MRLVFDGVRRVLCLGAHPDDIEIGCGGTIRRLTAEVPGLEVRWIVMSADGERADEARAGAERFLAGVERKTITVAAFRDAWFPAQFAELKGFFRELALEAPPDLVFTHRCEDVHQDHRTVAELTWQTFRDQPILEYEIPKYEGDLGHPNVFAPLSRELCAWKIDGLLASFPSQRERAWFTPETFWATLRLRGVESQSPTGFAEGLYGRKLVIA
jgi:LmbE family N-acetylglucosaminyl deacetylase